MKQKVTTGRFIILQKQHLVLILTLIGSLLVASSVLAADFDLTKFGLKPANSYDFGGETVTIISWTSERMANYFKDDLAVMGRIEAAEELFNVKIDFMQTRDIPAVNFNRLMSGESINDLWHLQHGIGYWELVSNNALYPVEEILPDGYYDQLPRLLGALQDAMRYQGQIWGIGPVEYSPLFGYIPMTFVAFNRTLLEREGLPDPYELYVDGEWTWEAATDIAIRATRDLTGTGENNQWGMSSVSVGYLAASNGADIVRTDEDGKVKFVADEPAFIEALEQYREWMSELEVLTTTGSFTRGQVAMHFDVGGGTFVTLMNNMVDEWGIVPYPKGPRMEENSWIVGGANTTGIPINAKDPEALLALKTFLWREEDVSVNDLLATYVPHEEAADLFLRSNYEWEGDVVFLHNPSLQAFHDEIQLIGTGEKSPTAAMAEIKPIIQSNLDELLNQ